MPITYAGGEMRHPADRIAKRLGPAAAEIWEMVKVDCPRTARSWMEKGGLGHVKSSLRTLQRAEAEWVRTLEEQGMDRTSAEMQARKWTSEGLVASEEELSAAENLKHPMIIGEEGKPEAEAEPEEDASLNLASEGAWGGAMELLFAGVDPGDLFAGPEKRAAALQKLAEYRKKQATGRSRKGAWPEGDWRPGMDTDGNELDWTKIDQALDAEERRLGRPLTMREIAEISSPILAQM